ncbi:class I SAM-dependent methyltransferase [Pseudomaricurvus hydrocarbonicus]|nr:class I SAM-dependent methyltransferase [Aestuariicella hydrocarbonica]
MRTLLCKAPAWSKIERFDPAWRLRIKRMASFIGNNDQVVIDVGCGPMWLREYIPESTTYIGIDYMKRGDEMIVCDINKENLPEMQADVWFISGCLEYINDIEKFITTASTLTNKFIISYCSTDYFPIKEERIKRGWKNDLTEQEIQSLFCKYGLVEKHYELLPSSNSLFVFEKLN